MWDAEQPRNATPGRACGLNFAGRPGGPKNKCLFVEDNPQLPVHGPGTEISYSVHRGLDLSLLIPDQGGRHPDAPKHHRHRRKEPAWTSPWTRQPPRDRATLQGESSTPSVGPATAQGPWWLQPLPTRARRRKVSHPPVPLGPGAPLSLRLRPGSAGTDGYGQMRALAYNPETGLHRDRPFPAPAPADERQACGRPPTTAGCTCARRKATRSSTPVRLKTRAPPALQELSTVRDRPGYSDASARWWAQRAVRAGAAATRTSWRCAIDPVCGYLPRRRASLPAWAKPPFLLLRAGREMLRGQRDSDTIVEFAFDSVSGMLTPTLNVVTTGSPVLYIPGRV